MSDPGAGRDRALDRSSARRDGDAPPVGPIERASGVIRGVARAAGRLAAAALASGAVLWWAVFRAVEDVGPVVVLAVVLIAPPAVLGLFVMGLRALVALPARLRDAPAAVRQRAGHIRVRAAEVSEARRRGVVRTLPALFRFWWSVATSREVLQVLSPALMLLTPWMLIAAVVAAGAAVAEVVAGAGALLWLLIA